MKRLHFHSSLGPALEDFIRFKRLQGFDYTSRALRLARFDRFLRHQGHTLPVLTREAGDAYIHSTAHLTPLGRHGELSAVRTFSKYLQTQQPESWVLAAYGFHVPRLVRFHLYSPGELAALLKTAQEQLPAGSPQGPCMHLLIGLLYTTGLRISEAVALNLTDMMPEQGRLLVRKGKFGKSRYVPLHPSTAERIQAWREIRVRHVRHDAGEPLFIGSRGQRLSRSRAEALFRRLILRCGIRDCRARLPRLHDLRHSYASECLRRWQAQGHDLNALLPVLSTVMGHVGLRSTQVYLHMLPAQLHAAMNRLHHHLFDRIPGARP